MTAQIQNNILKTYFLLTYVTVLILVSDSIPVASIFQDGLIPTGFMLITWLLYGLYYLLPAIAITALIKFISKQNTRAVYATAVITGGMTTLLMYANAKLFSLYGMFFNGFILNLVATPGGIESLGGSSASDVGFALITLGFISLQAAILWLVHRFYVKKSAPQLSFKFLPITAIIATVLVHMGFALDSYTTNQLNVVAQAIPFYQTVSARGFFKSLGFTMQRETKRQTQLST